MCGHNVGVNPSLNPDTYRSRSLRTPHTHPLSLPMGAPPQASRPGGPLHPLLPIRLVGPSPSSTLFLGLQLLSWMPECVSCLPSNLPHPPPAPEPGQAGTVLELKLLPSDSPVVSRAFPPVDPGPTPFSLTSISISVFCSLIPETLLPGFERLVPLSSQGHVFSPVPHTPPCGSFPGCVFSLCLSH